MSIEVTSSLHIFYMLVTDYRGTQVRMPCSGLRTKTSTTIIYEYFNDCINSSLCKYQPEFRHTRMKFKRNEAMNTIGFYISGVWFALNLVEFSYTFRLL